MAIHNIEDRPEEGIVVDLTGPEGNAFAILGLANRLAKQLGWDKVRIDDLRERMMAGDYEHLLEVFDEAFGDFVTMYR